MGVIQGAINRTLGAAATVTMAQHAIGQKQNKLIEKQKMANDKAEQELKAKQEQKKRYQVEKRRAYKTAITIKQLKTQADIEARRVSGYNG